MLLLLMIAFPFCEVEVFCHDELLVGYARGSLRVARFDYLK